MGIEEEAVSHEITIFVASCAVKLCAKKVLMVMIIHYKIYFMFFLFMVYANHEKNFTTKISRSTVIWQEEPTRKH